MTLETAQRIMQEGLPNKEAQAVVRGGMTICELEDNGVRTYNWIKIYPTKTDNESSIQLALNNYRKKKESLHSERKRSVINVDNKKADSQLPTTTVSLKIESEQRDTLTISTLVQSIKKRFNDFVKTMDGLVEE
jgi:hypothetical protein